MIFYGAPICQNSSMTANSRRAPATLGALLLVAISLFWASAQVSLSTEDSRPEGDLSQLEAALARRGSVDFVEQPLRDVVAEIGKQFQIPILLAAKRLAEASVSPETPVNKRLPNLPLESILKLILEELDLTFTIRHNVILITTPEDQESQLTTRVYPVCDLVASWASPSRGIYESAATDYDSLIDMITLTLSPQSWNDVGGPGSIEGFNNAASLVVSQTRDVHRQVENLLTTLRRAKLAQPAFPLSTASASRPFASSSSSASASRPYSPPLRPLRVH